MNQITLDDELKAELNGLTRTVEVRDTDGKTLGQFVPQDEYMRLLYAWAKAEVSEEEPDRVSRETGGRPLSEILKRLGAV